MNAFQPAFHGAIENHVTTGRKRPTPVRKVLFDSPDLFASRWIPRNKLTAVAAWARMAHHDRTNIGLTGLVLDLYALVIHAEVVRGNVKEVRSRRVGDGLLILSSHGRRTDILCVFSRRSPLLGNLDGPAGLQIYSCSPIDINK